MKWLIARGKEIAELDRNIRANKVGFLLVGLGILVFAMYFGKVIGELGLGALVILWEIWILYAVWHFLMWLYDKGNLKIKQMRARRSKHE